MSFKKICQSCIPLLTKSSKPVETFYSSQYSARYVERCLGRVLGTPETVPDTIPENISWIIHGLKDRNVVHCGDDILYLFKTRSDCMTTGLSQMRRESSCNADKWVGKRLSGYDTSV